MKPDNHQQQQFSELLESNRGIIYKVASTYCWHPDDRAELTQEIVLQLWRAYPKYDSRQLFSTWMYRIALNVAISYVRHNCLRQRHLVELDDQNNEQMYNQAHDTAGHAHSAVDHKDQLDFLHRFINSLDSLNRAVLLLYMEERSYREIADILGITETNVATKINRLKQRIRTASNETPTSDRKTDNDTNNDRSRQHGT